MSFDMVSYLMGKNSSGGGGGGGGDFSTAQVTLIGATPGVIDVPNAGNFPYIDNNEIVSGGNSLQLGTYTVVLYKGSLKFTTMIEPASTTGAISEFEIVGKNAQATITGDCSMTFEEIV